MKRMLCWLFMATYSMQASSMVKFTNGWSIFDQEGMGVGSVLLTIDGTPRVAWDFTLHQSAMPGQWWFADLISLPTVPPEFPGPNQARNYYAVTWIAQDFLSTATKDEKIALQYALYGVFAPDAPSNAASQAELQYAYSRAALGFAPGWTFVESVNDQKQDFLYHTDKGTVPEPGTLALLGLGLLGLTWRRLWLTRPR